eukprot:g22615.t1
MVPAELGDAKRFGKLQKLLVLLLRLGSSKLKQIPRTRLQDSEAGLHWMVRDLPGQPEFYATNLHFLSADCAVFLLVCKATDDERTREQQLRLWLSALDSLGAYHRACCTVLVCTHQDQLEPPQLQRAQEWLQELAPRLSSEFKHAHLDASGMLLDCETEKAPAMLRELRKRVAQAGHNLL